MNLIQKAREFLTFRALSYRRVFAPESMDVAAVLRDLARFCRAHESTAHQNSYAAARLDGRREVWLRIQHHLKLSDVDLWYIYSGKPIQKGEDK